ncbi:unnamed protein product [Prorocentrum cordatum]|uniref:Uncharacterized protein n=1 Tax=Prorocentrum cordatum TaxID=2364126 RepID=A0ABN9XT69_9DINO|nr:unnamed protein product [Polarella glacialis]
MQRRASSPGGLLPGFSGGVPARVGAATRPEAVRPLVSRESALGTGRVSVDVSSLSRSPSGMAMLEQKRLSVPQRTSHAGKNIQKETRLQGALSSSSSGHLYPAEQDGTVDEEHDFHYQYNRRLECSSQPVVALRFTPDGSALVSGNHGADIKMWDTKNWSRLARFQKCPGEALCTVAVSLSQRWVVCVYPSVVQVYKGHSPHTLVLSLPAAAAGTGIPAGEGAAGSEPVPPSGRASCASASSSGTDATGPGWAAGGGGGTRGSARISARAFRWASAAFSPTREVNHQKGLAGQDNYLAILGTGHLRVLDYAAGWREDMPSHTCSLLQGGVEDAHPTSSVFTSDGVWIVCAFSSGQMQIWSASSLGLHKTVSAHTGCITCLDPSPLESGTACRVISCSTDKTLRLWDSFGGNFTMEQHVFDSEATDAGVRQCVFSASCRWVLSISSELTLWRVVCVRTSMQLHVHQRFTAAQCVDNPCAAAFCHTTDAIAVGLRDGTLCLWTLESGAPAKSKAPRASASGKDLDSRPYTTPTPTGRPMQRMQSVESRLPDIVDQFAPQAQLYYQSSPSAHAPTRQRPSAQVLSSEFGASPADLHGARLLAATPPTSPLDDRPRSHNCKRVASMPALLVPGSPDGPLLSPAGTTRLLQGQNRPLVKRISLLPQSIALS